VSVIFKANDNQWFLTKVKQAIADYRMIQDGDRVAVGLSGGKDSMLLLLLLDWLRRYSHLNFQLGALHIALDRGEDTQPLQAYCLAMEVPYYEERTDITEIIFSRRQEKNPCALCSKMRRGALVKAAEKLGYNKIALGHHGDDALETLLLNGLVGGRLKSFTPLIRYPDNGIAIIRPMIYLRERTVTAVARREKLPVQASLCPMDRNTKRQEMKNLLQEIEARVPRCGDSLLTGLKEQWLLEAADARHEEDDHQPGVR